MIEKILKIERYITKKNEETGDYSFGVEINNSKKFIYLQTNPQEKKSIENWKNNFSDGWEIDGKLYLFSIEGISTFDLEFSNRKDYKIERSDKNYFELEKLINYSRENGKNKNTKISNLLFIMIGK